MDLITKKRFNKALNAAISSLDDNARGFCYRTDKEYQSFISGLKEYQRKLINEIHEEQEKLKTEYEDEKISKTGKMLIDKHIGALKELAKDD